MSAGGYSIITGNPIISTRPELWEETKSRLCWSNLRSPKEMSRSSSDYESLYQFHYKFNFFSQIAFINYAVVDYIQSSHYFGVDPSIYLESLAEHLHLNEPWKRNFPSSKFNQVECGSQIRYHSIFSQACSNCSGQVFHTCHVSHESFHLRQKGLLFDFGWVQWVENRIKNVHIMSHIHKMISGKKEG